MNTNLARRVPKNSRLYISIRKLLRERLVNGYTSNLKLDAYYGRRADWAGIIAVRIFGKPPTDLWINARSLRRQVSENLNASEQNIVRPEDAIDWSGDVGWVPENRDMFWPAMRHDVELSEANFHRWPPKMPSREERSAIVRAGLGMSESYADAVCEELQKSVTYRAPGESSNLENISCIFNSNKSGTIRLSISPMGLINDLTSRIIPEKIHQAVSKEFYYDVTEEMARDVRNTYVRHAPQIEKIMGTPVVIPKVMAESGRTRVVFKKKISMDRAVKFGPRLGGMIALINRKAARILERKMNRIAQYEIDRYIADGNKL